MNSIAEQIMANYNLLKQDPEVAEAFGKLKFTNYQAHLKGALESFVDYLNFDSHKHALQYVKALDGRLARDTELAFAERTEQAARSYEALLSHGREVDSLYASTGINSILSQHSEKIFYHFSQNPLLKKEFFVHLGATAAQIGEVSSLAERNNWNILTMYGADGTFSGLLQVASAEVPRLRDLARVTREDGLPTLEGASGGGGVVAGIVAGIVAACIIVALLGVLPCIVGVAAAGG
jgi:hypothetical protein